MDASIPTSKGRAQARYEELLPKRAPILQRARDCALYTIPSLMPPEGSNGSTELYKPYQSIGARGVNNLAAKLHLTLLPPTRRFYRLILTEKAASEIPDEEKSQWEVALSRVEERIAQHMETLGLRVSGFELMRQLVNSGNAVLFVGDKDSRVFTLDQYVVKRDGEGNLLDLVVKECVYPEEMPESIRPQIQGEMTSKGEKTADLYTHVYRKGNRYKVYQEIRGIHVPDSDGDYPLLRCPWLVLRWTRKTGDDYGRSHCDDYYGDLVSAEGLSRSIIRAAAIAAKVIFRVNPNGTLDPTDLEKVEEGGFVEGNEGDIEAITLDKHADFTVARATLEDIVTRLSYAFLLNSAVRRNGERVTAEEIRYMAGELEDALGGSYSILSQEFQLPLVEIVIGRMQAKGDMPTLPKDTIRPTIVTGIDALGRSHELARLDAFLAGAVQTFGPEILQYINVADYLRRRAAGLDLDPAGLVKSEEQIAAAQQAAQQSEMVNKLGGPVIKAMSDQALAARQASAPAPGASANA